MKAVDLFDTHKTFRAKSDMNSEKLSAGALKTLISLFISLTFSFASAELPKAEFLSNLPIQGSQIGNSDTDKIKVAAFDADWTLRRSRHPKEHYPRTVEDQIIFNDAVQKIRELNQRGYLVVVFSNQTGAWLPKEIQNRKEIFSGMIQDFATQGARIDYYDFASVWEPWNQKPRAGLFNKLAHKLAKKNLVVDHTQSFYVGDSGYKKGDKRPWKFSKHILNHDNYDREFARQSGISFYLADSFFDRTPTAPNETPPAVLEKIRSEYQVLEKRWVTRIENLENQIQKETVYLSNAGNKPLDLSKMDLKHLSNLNDQLNVQELKALIELTLKDAEFFLEVTRSQSSRKQFQSTQRIYMEVVVAANDYFEKETFYGQNNDNERFNAFRSYLKKYSLWLNHVEKNKLTSTESLLQLYDLKKAIASISQLTRIGWATFRPAIKLLHAIFFRPTTPNGQTPITTETMNLFEQWGKASGLKIETEGLDRIPKTKPGEVNLYLPNHFDANLDFHVLSALGIKDYVTFGALNIEGTKVFSFAMQKRTKFIINQILKNDHFFLLGQGIDAGTRLIEALKKGKSQNFLLFSQGLVSLGLRESLPIRDGLTQLITRLQAEGLKINLVPIAMPNNARTLPMKDPMILKSDESKPLKLIVGEPILNGELLQLKENQQLSSLSVWLRAWWLTQMKTDNSFVVGVKKWKGTLKDLQERRWLTISPAAEPTGSCRMVFH